MNDKVDVTQDHAGLNDAFASRRYFRKCGKITQHLMRVSAVMQAEGRLSKDDVEVITRYVTKNSRGVSCSGRKTIQNASGWKISPKDGDGFCCIGRSMTVK